MQQSFSNPTDACLALGSGPWALGSWLWALGSGLWALACFCFYLCRIGSRTQTHVGISPGLGTEKPNSAEFLWCIAVVVVVVVVVVADAAGGWGCRVGVGLTRDTGLCCCVAVGYATILTHVFPPCLVASTMLSVYPLAKKALCLSLYLCLCLCVSLSLS